MVRIVIDLRCSGFSSKGVARNVQVMCSTVRRSSHPIHHVAHDGNCFGFKNLRWRGEFHDLTPVVACLFPGNEMRVNEISPIRDHSSQLSKLKGSDANFMSHGNGTNGGRL